MIPLGDQAILVYLPDEAGAFGFAQLVRSLGVPWLVDVVQAYKSVAVFYDMDRIESNKVRHVLHEARARPATTGHTAPSRLHEIPCCYEFQLDIPRIAEHTGRSSEEIIRLHADTEYTVYAIGFCPGFPYLGYLAPELAGVPRLDSPRLRLEAGSVGLTGKQTGIYTEPRPGGWNIIGRTPLQLVSLEDEYFPLRTGDRVRFVRIDESVFYDLQYSRL